MPHTTYGLLGAMRSHLIDRPDLAVTLTTGRPDACSLCHIDRPLAWTAEALARWYGHERPELSALQTEVSAAALWALRGDAGQRALAAWHLGWGPARAVGGGDWQVAILAALLMDPYAAVRHVAARALRRLPVSAGVEIDPDGSAEARAAVRDLLIGLQPRGAADPARLRGADGGPDEAAIRGLIAERDERPVDLRE